MHITNPDAPAYPTSVLVRILSNSENQCFLNCVMSFMPEDFSRLNIGEVFLPNALKAIIDAAESNAERAEQAAEDAEEWASHSPYIDPDTSHWWVWDGTQHEFVDTGISADGSTTSYASLSNKPQIEGNELVGNKTASQLGLQKTLVIDSDGYINL